MSVPILTSTSNLTDEQKDIIQRIGRLAQAQGGGVQIINGMFGDMTECDGVVENIFEGHQIGRPYGGMFVKAFGNPHYFKGVPRKEFVDMIGLPKSMVSLIPRELMRDWSVWVYLLFKFIFRRRHFWHMVRTIFHRIHDLSLLKVRYQHPYQYSRPVQEMRGKFNEAMRQLYEVNMDSNVGLRESTNYIGKREKYIALTCVHELFCDLIEGDNAYRLKLQDVFKEYNRDNAESNIKKEILRLLDILIARERQNLMVDKWKFIKKVVAVILLIPSIKKFIKFYFLSLEKNNLIPDDDDWYCSLRRSGYDFGGLSVEERIKIKENIDREKGHIPMQTTVINMKEVIIDDNILADLRNNIPKEGDPETNSKLNNLKNIIARIPQIQRQETGIKLI